MLIATRAKTYLKVTCEVCRQPIYAWQYRTRRTVVAHIACARKSQRLEAPMTRTSHQATRTSHRRKVRA